MDMEEVIASKHHGTRKRKTKTKRWIYFQSCFESPTEEEEDADVEVIVVGKGTKDGKKRKSRSKFSRLWIRGKTEKKTVPLEVQPELDPNASSIPPKDRNNKSGESDTPQSHPIAIDATNLQRLQSSSPLTTNTPILCQSPWNSSKVVGFAGILVVMSTALAGGRLFAIVCISVWFYLIPLLRSSRNVHIQTCSENMIFP